METEPAASNDSTPPESTPDEPVPAVPTKETTPIWAQTNPAAPAHKKGDPDWSKTVPPANGGASKPAREWAATVPSSPGEPVEVLEPDNKGEEQPAEKVVSTEPPVVAAITDPPKAVAADALKSTWPPASPSSPAPPQETDIWPPEPPTERAMPAWPPSSEMEEEPPTPAEAIPSWPDSFDAVPATSTPPPTKADPVKAEPAPAAPIPPTVPPATVQPVSAPAEPPESAVASAPPAPTVRVTPVAEPAPEPPPATAPAPTTAPATEPPPVRPSQSAPPSRPAWAPSPASAEPVTPVAKAPSMPQMQVPAWAPRVPLASEPGTPTWFSPKEEIPHATAQPIAQPATAAEPEPAPPIVGGQLPVAQIPVASQPTQPSTQQAKVSTWEIVEQPRKSGPHAPAQAGPTAEDRSYAEWFAWAKRGGAPATACHAAAQGAFKALSSGKDVNTAVQWATAAMSRPPEPVGYARQQYCAWFALANIDLNLDQHRAHLFSAAAIQALDAGQDASAAHAAGLAAAGIR